MQGYGKDSYFDTFSQTMCISDTISTFNSNKNTEPILKTNMLDC